MAANFILFDVHFNKPFKPRCCVETFLNYKHKSDVRKANFIKLAAIDDEGSITIN